MKQDSSNKPPIGPANTGYEHEVESKPPFGEALVAELRRIFRLSGKKKVKSDDKGKNLNTTGN